MVEVFQEESVVKVIRSALEISFGRSTAKAVDFYFDSRVAVGDPAGYTKMLRKTFLGGADSIIESITGELCKKYSVEHLHGMSLADCLLAIKARSGPLA